MRYLRPVPVLRPALALLPLLVALAAAPLTHAQSSREKLLARLDSLAGAPVQEGRAVGISVAVVRGSDTLLLRGYGKADLELDVKTPDGAVYEIGSVTKQFTAAAILKLRDEGKLDLEADLTTYLPSYPTAGHKLPVRRLLDHTSGIKGLTEIPAFRQLRVRQLPRDSAVALFSALPFEFPPGEAMIYNNSAYFLLGLIIEKVSGMSYEDYVEQRLFAPLGMKDSRYCSNTEVVQRRAHGYEFDGQTVRRADYINHTWPYAAGSLCSSAGDLVAWLTALHGGKVLSERSYREMTTPARLNDGTELRYGMGLSLGTDVRGARLIGHGGAISGFTADASWYPDAQLAVVVLMNSEGPGLTLGAGQRAGRGDHPAGAAHAAPLHRRRRAAPRQVRRPVARQGDDRGGNPGRAGRGGGGERRHGPAALLGGRLEVPPGWRHPRLRAPRRNWPRRRAALRHRRWAFRAPAAVKLHAMS